MSRVDLEAPLRFLRTAYEPGDWVAVFLKSYETGRTTQRVGPVSLIAEPRFQAWLRAQNASRSNVYISVNTLAPHQRSRRRDAVRNVRHVFLEADHDGGGVLARIAARPDLPSPSYVLHSSPGRVHVFWRVSGFTAEHVEALQKQLARELDTDHAATPCTQTTRIPGYKNYKRRQVNLVTIDYLSEGHVHSPAAFPTPIVEHRQPSHIPSARRLRSTTSVQDRARRYLAAVPPAIAGQHGDLHTFQVCCRLVRGFALPDGDALNLLAEWNARCEPPWSERELEDKVRRARRYGREPIGGLVEAPL
jgi:hypothetical protein